MNRQVGNLVFGVETDIQVSDQKGTTTSSQQILAILTGFGQGLTPATLTDSAKLKWFGTARGRVGFADDRWLVYATGGIAYGGVSENGVVQPSGPNFNGTGNNAPIRWRSSATKVGWTLGAGVENAITANWSWKVEYLYMNLGKVTDNVSGGGAPLDANLYSVGGGGQTFRFVSGGGTARLTDNIVRLGISYKFGGPAGSIY